MLQWHGTRALVTGATGFIGSHLTRRLEQLGADVHAVSRSEQEPLRTVAWHQCDLRDADATSALVGSLAPDLIFHLASEVTGNRDVGMVRATLDANLGAAVNLLTAAVGTGTRLVFAGSVEEPRDDRTVPHSPYAAAKYAATAYAQLFHRLWGVPVTVLRIAMAYGPGQRDTAKLVPHVATELLQGRAPRLASGTRLIDWVYIDDVIEAFVRAAENDRATGGMYDIGGGVGLSIKDTVDLMGRLAGSTVAPEYGALPDRQADRAHIADLAPTGAKLGWQPRTALEDGLKNTLEWYRRG
ncbi:NAD-dependent epimerase/dehydratase family protein [Nonomuraea sp. NBC_01738]|uniref:NAD-dependent epimerase/dehydratase family protein n=1 Tax=Nonomuraea sp. NBC_01738 TaxID=2976003 RepID=UPI002E1462A1|nr:NAD-dependent epimerase/dehydratase family protein [Nonomuraea sp. NBC_01738]